MAAKKSAMKCAGGYEFVSKGTAVMLRRKGSTAATGTTFSCTCTGDGGGKVDIDGDTATCIANEYSRSCNWSVNIPGLTNMKVMASVLKMSKEEPTVEERAVPRLRNGELATSRHKNR